MHLAKKRNYWKQRPFGRTLSWTQRTPDKFLLTPRPGEQQQVRGIGFAKASNGNWGAALLMWPRSQTVEHNTQLRSEALRQGAVAYKYLGYRVEYTLWLVVPQT